jgi:Sulfotransferase family
MPMIVGVGRSGTTLLRLMLDAHPYLAVPPETGFLLPLAGRRNGAEISAEELGSVLTGFHTWGDFGLPAELFRRELLALRPFSVPEGVRLFYRLYAQRHGKARWGDKTPGYGRQIEEIEAVLPEAHFIHLIRDGRDVAVSLREVWFAPGQDIPTLARHWAEGVEATRAAGRRCRQYLEIRYEDLVLDTRRTLQRVSDFIDLPFAVEMEAYHRKARQRLGEVRNQLLPDGSTVITRGQRLHQHRWTSVPPQAARIGRWRAELSREEQSVFISLAGPLLADLGYEPAGPDAGR